MDCSLSGSSVHGILQARILEWVAMPSSRGSSRPRDRTVSLALAGRFSATSTTLLLLSCSVVSDPMWPHGLQHARPPCPSPSPGVCSNSCPLSRWCHPAISSCVVSFSSLPSVFPSIRVFSSESALRIRWPEYWNFSINPSNEYSGLISFNINWFDLAVHGTLKNLLQHHSSKTSIQPTFAES